MKLILPALLLCAVAPAMAQPTATPDQMKRMLDAAAKADASHDGFLTRAEWLNYRGQQFARFDRNHDGILSAADAPPIVGTSMIAEALRMFDTNHDGQVSHDEFVTGPTPAFESADIDHNGVIDPYEMKKAHAQ